MCQKGVSVWTVVQLPLPCGGGMAQVIICVMHVDFTTRWMARTDLSSDLNVDW